MDTEWLRVVLDDLGLPGWDLRIARGDWYYRGLTLSLDPGKAHEPRRIIVRGGMEPYETLYTLLHEAAHALAPQDYTEEAIHGRDFLRVLVMIAGFYGFTLDYIASASGECVFPRHCPHDITEPGDPCQPSSAALKFVLT
jgi:hypothetical protein